MSKLRAIDFACNDPDNGLFAGKVWRAEIGDNEIEAPGFKAFAFTIVQRGERRYIRIHRSLYRFEVQKCWFGNWCWDRFWLRPEEMERLLNHLRENGWRCSSGDPDFKAMMNEQPAS